MGTVYSITAFDHTTGQATITGHGRATGDGPAALFSANGPAPTGLTQLADLWLIVIDANTVKFADSSAHALAGTALTFSDNGNAVASYKLLYGIPFRRARTYVPRSVSVAGAEVKSADLNGMMDAQQTSHGPWVHGAASWFGISGATITVPTDTSASARVDLATSGKAYCPLPEAVPGLTIGSIDCNVSSVAGGTAIITVNLMRQKVDLSVNAEVVATGSASDTGGIIPLSVAANHAVAAGYFYWLTASQSGVGTGKITQATVVPG